MSANSATNLKSRLRVIPIDEWSTREKLCLASSVLKSGDQNWSSVSRPLKSFAEPNRPNDWFHQKYCAIQYHDLLEKIETETPKRKRSERGEETPQTIIVRNLTKQRIEELKRITQTERESIAKFKRDLEAIKSNKMSEKRLQEILNDIKDKEIKEKEREVEHKKWLEEREVKIAQMSRKGTLHPRKPTPSVPMTPPVPQTPSTASPVSTPTTTSTVTENEAKSRVIEPLKVEVDSETNSVPTTPQNQTESKLSLALTSPSTSPLLTSLLQSPTPSTPNILSPNKSGLSTNSLRPKPLTQVSTPLNPITRRPSIHSSPQKIIEEKTKDNSVVSNTKVVDSNVSADNIEPTQQKTTIDSSKLTKPLDTTNTNKEKGTAIEVKPTVAQIASDELMEQTVDISDPIKSDVTATEEIQIIESKSNDSTKRSEENDKNVDTTEKLVRNTDKTQKTKTDSESDEIKDDIKETDQTNSDKKCDESDEMITIKQEIIDTNSEEDKTQKEGDRTGIKEEPMDSTSTTTEEDSNQRTPSNRTTKRTRKTPHPITITPTAMRRSRRVALKDSKSANDESTEVSDQSAANTPQEVKKRGSVDDTTETSMSGEESMDAKSIAPPASIETVPNSPASIRTEDMDKDSKEYRTWKKAIMVNWRLISAHKNASLFSHPVTEAEAKGYEDIVHLPMDLNSIKKRVETGVIRTTIEYERDILLMFQNAIMFNNVDHDVHKMAVDMQKDTIDMIEEFIQTRKHDNQSNESKLRARDRRSNVSTPSTSIIDNEISGRRKSRGASTDTDSNASGLTKSLTKKKKN